MRGNVWSYSWVVVYFMYSYLSNFKLGFWVVRKFLVSEFVLGDVICYDFEGDGRWNYMMIVVVKDGYGMFFVNVNMYNSWMRYWVYEDLMVYMLKIKYDFFYIVDW